MSASEDI